MPLHELTQQFLTACLTEQNAFSYLKSLCTRFPNRISGSQNEKLAAEWFLQEMNHLGYETELQPFTYSGWNHGNTYVTLHHLNHNNGAPTNLACFPLGWSPGTRVKASAIDVGYGTEEDFQNPSIQGKIVLVSSANKPGKQPLHRSSKYCFAEEAGAVGFIFYNDRPGGLAAMGSINNELRMGTIPAAGISYEDAMAIKEASRENPDRLQVEIASECTGESIYSQNAIATKHGTSLSTLTSTSTSGANPQGEILLGAHIDSWFNPGANDNGSGIVTLLELARLTAKFSLGRTIRFIAFGSEEVGLIGSKYYVDHRADIQQVDLMMNMDVCVLKDSQFVINALGNPILCHALSQLVQQIHVRTTIDNFPTDHSDHKPFFNHDIPAFFAYCSGSTYGFAHTVCDTLDKLDSESFTIPLLVTGAFLIETCVSGATFKQQR